MSNEPITQITLVKKKGSPPQIYLNVEFRSMFSDAGLTLYTKLTAEDIYNLYRGTQQ